MTLKDPGYEDKFIDWILSEYRDESQLLPIAELQNRLAFVKGKVLNNEENLFLIQSTLKVVRKILNIDAQEEQKLAIIMLYFVNKAQREQVKKIPHPHAIAREVLFWTQGKAIAANQVFKAILDSETLINSNYLENFARWLTSKEQDQAQLLTGEKLQKALQESAPPLTLIENNFLVRSLVFNLRHNS